MDEKDLLLIREKVLAAKRIRQKKKPGRKPVNKEKGAMTLLERHARWRENKRDHYNDYQRVYHRMYRRKKRAEQSVKAKDTTTNDN